MTPEFRAIVLCGALALGSELLAQSRTYEEPRSLSLSEAVALAEETSERVGAATSGLVRADAELGGARAEWFPQISGSVSYTRTLASQFESLRGPGDGAPSDVVRPSDCAPFVPDPGLAIPDRIDALGRTLECIATATPDLGGSFEDLPFGRENQYLLGLSFSQPIYAGGRIGSSIQASLAAKKAAEVELVSARAAVALEVVEAYFDAALNARMVEISEATLVQARATAQQTRVAYRVGAQAEFDMLRAMVVSENQEPVVIEARADRDLSYLRLKQLMDLPAEQPIRLSTPLGDDALPPLLRLASLPAPGERQEVPEPRERAPVREAIASVDLRRAQLGVASAARRPTLTLTSSYGLLRFPETVLPTTGEFLNDWTVTIAAQMPLFTFGRLEARENAARASLEEARTQLELTAERTALDTAEAYQRLRAAEARLEASAGTVATAVRAYEIAEVRYQEGISTQLELTDTRLQLQQAEMNRARAARDLQVAAARVALLPYLPLETGPSMAPMPQEAVPTSPEFQIPSPSIPTPADPRQPAVIGARDDRVRR